MTNGSRYSYIIWDWNGTLLDDAALCVEVMNSVLAARGLPLLTLARYGELLDFPIVNYYARLGFDFAAEPFEIPATQFIDEYYRRWSECSLAEGAVQALRAFSELRCAQSILSAAPQVILGRALQHYGIGDYFTTVSGLADHYARGKVENGRRLVAESGIDPRRILLIGDTLHDLEAAKAMGVECALVPGGHCGKPRLMASGGLVLPDLAAVVRFAASEDNEVRAASN